MNRDTDRLLARIARLEAQSDIRGRAVVIYRERAREAEAERDQAYEWADDQSHPLVMRQGEVLTGVANALNGPTPPRTSWSHHDLAEKAAAMVARAEQAEAERDEWRQTALDERAAALDALKQIKVRDARAADIWEQGSEAGFRAADTGDVPPPNPYRASETA